MLCEDNLTVTHAFRNREGNLCGSLGEVCPYCIDTGQRQVRDTVEVRTLDGDGLTGLHVLRRISAADSCQRHSDINGCRQARGGVHHDGT